MSELYDVTTEDLIKELFSRSKVTIIGRIPKNDPETAFMDYEGGRFHALGLAEQLAHDLKKGVLTTEKNHGE
jgi:hypothetical protein